jgi:competence protein ComEA
VLAQRIIEYRQTHGRFQSVDELLEVRGIGPKRLENMRPYVVVK